MGNTDTNIKKHEAGNKNWLSVNFLSDSRKVSSFCFCSSSKNSFLMKKFEGFYISA